MPLDLDVIATNVVLTVKTALAPYQERVAMLEQATKDLRERLITLETVKAAPMPGPVGPPGPQGDVGPMGPAGPAGRDGLQGPIGEKGVNGLDGKDGAPGRDGSDGKDGMPGRDGRDGMPGPAGEKGINGLDGKDGAPGRDGLHGKDGSPGLEWAGIYKDDRPYVRGQIVKWGGNTYVCLKETTGIKPDAMASLSLGSDGAKQFTGINGKDFWDVFVSKGDKGKDGRDAPSLPVVKVG